MAQQPKQQRPLYNLALLAYADKGFKKAEELITQALKHSNWQRYPSGRRLGDLHFNRACFRSRLGEQTDDERYADLVVEDLEQTCKHLSDEIKRTFDVDSKSHDPDLGWAWKRRPDEMQRLAKQLRTVSNP